MSLAAKASKINAYKSTHEQVSIANENLMQGRLPDEMMGLNLPTGGNSIFSGIAHSVKQAQYLSNLANNDVDDELIITVQDGKGNIRKTPYKLGNVTMVPNSAGQSRITDSGKLALKRKIHNFQQARVDKLMEDCLMGDDICQYIFGVTPANWDLLTKPIALSAIPEKYSRLRELLSTELANLNCSIKHIQSLPPSQTQSQCVAKLRAIVTLFEPNVNIEGLSNIDDFTNNGKTGANNIYKLAEDNGVMDAAEMQKRRDPAPNMAK